MTHELNSGLLIAASIAIGVWAMPANQTAQDVRPKPTGFVLGQVVDSSGRAVAGAVVTISNPGPPPPQDASTAPNAPRQVLADSSGRFLFRELGKGRYTIRATCPGYIGAAYGQTRPSGASQLIEIARDDEKLDGVMVKIWKVATITGTVVDEAGDPVVGLSVRVFSRQISGGKVRLNVGVTAITDDRGVYRIADLAPGDYLVGVLSSQTTMPVATAEAFAQQTSSGTSVVNSDLYRELTSSAAPSASSPGFRVGDLMLMNPFGRGSFGSSPPPTPTDSGQLLLYTTQFFPSARTPARATVITLESGQNRAGVDFQLKLVPTVRLSGTVVGPDGPARNFGLRLLPSGYEDPSSASGLEMASTVTDGGGEFTFLGVTPGEYTLKALRVPRAPITPSPMTTVEVTGPNGLVVGMSSSAGTLTPAPLPADPTLWAVKSLTVGETNVTGISVSLLPGARLSGRLTFEGKDSPAPEQIQRATISISLMSGPVTTEATIARRIEGDGRFATGGYPPGRYIVTAFMPSAGPVASPWTFKSVTVGGRAVEDDGLEIGAEDISDLVIAFTDQPPEFSGTVTDRANKPDQSASVVVIPADSQVWRQGIINSRRVRIVRTTTAGTYTVTALPSGRYVVVALEDSTLADWQDPKMLEKLFALGTPITIGDGEKKTLALTTKQVR
jgi:protocatechuate 3,4-dioxygenase beta subunit